MTDVLDRLTLAEPRERSVPTPDRPRVRRALNPTVVRVAATLSIAAAAIHLVMVPSHAAESSAEGIGFALGGWFQVLTAVLLLVRPSRRWLGPVAVANVVFIAAWVWSRTAGLPIGAHAGQAETMGFVDLTTVGFEVALLLCCG